MTNHPSHYRGVVFYHEYLARGQSRYWTPITGEDKFYRTEEMVRSVIDDHLARLPNAPLDGDAEVYRGVWYRVSLYGVLRKRLQYYALRPGPEGVYGSKVELCAAIDEFIARQPKPQPPAPSAPPPPVQAVPAVVAVAAAAETYLHCRNCGTLNATSKLTGAALRCGSCGATL
jgi:hypothetical protein